MTMLIEETQVFCPYCGERFDTAVDCSAGSQVFVEDCPVCCQPIDFQLRVDDEGGFRELVPSRDSD